MHPRRARPADSLRGSNLIRDDSRKPVFIVNSELEAIACYGVRQPDSDRLRWWESAGTCHVSQQSLAARARMAQRDQIVTRPSGGSINAIPIGPLYDAAYHHMHSWLSDGIPPPVQPRIAFAGDPAQVVRDADGIAQGGIRLPQVEVPLAQNSAIPLSNDIFAYLGGSSRPFAAAELRDRYGKRETFLARFEQAARRAVSDGVLRPHAVDGLLVEAAATWPD
ncbi:MAG: hypothetical protein HC809_01410 [Gammaproteobacteria bacterium]|nr:hypothetical protein [Gammaproteobacteria bacterium]